MSITRYRKNGAPAGVIPRAVSHPNSSGRRSATSGKVCIVIVRRIATYGCVGRSSIATFIVMTRKTGGRSGTHRSAAIATSAYASTSASCCCSFARIRSTAARPSGSRSGADGERTTSMIASTARTGSPACRP